MGRRRSVARRSATELIVRSLLASGVGVVGYISVAATLGYATRVATPERAYAFAPHDGRVTAALALKVSGADGGPVDRTRARRLALTALRQDPTAVTAVVVLGFDAQVAGRDGATARLFDYAEMLSRRDLLTQLWKIETAVAKGDVTEALRHYDIALRTSQHATDLLFPILATAIADPAIRAALSRTMAARPGWSDSFIEYAAANSPDPRMTSLLFRQLQLRSISITPVAQMLLIDTLASRGMFLEAWLYYSSVRSSTDRHRSRDPRFTADLSDRTVFDWRLVNDSGISVSLQRDINDGGLVDFAAPPSVGGAVVQQMQVLPPGRYRLSGQAAGLTNLSPVSRPYWVMTCRDGHELGRIDVPGAGDFSGTFDVGASCPIQTLTLMLRPSDTMTGVAGQLERAALVPS